MLIILQKRTLFRFSKLLLIFVFIGILFQCFHNSKQSILTFSPLEQGRVIIIDPGHGGEDGGAVSSDGTILESHINLSIANRLNYLFSFTGQYPLLTRQEDVSIDSGGNTVRQRKMSDLKNRVAFVNQQQNAVLLSIHQNSLPSSPATHGAQVFYNRQNSAKGLANSLQTTLNECINQEKAKSEKQIPDTIYLLKNIKSPGIIVECGFLSNANEAVQLKEPAHQKEIALAITTGYLQWITKEGDPS